ncbi:MAG: hypothetical protein HY868_16500 [Chloroflexi bacterium]|nr:hypothetical protein [Chloroflexota bacterium]
MISRYQVFRERIANEWHDIRRAADKAQQAFHISARGGKDETFYLDSTALNLHGFYNGVEQLFEWIAKEFDDTVPSGSAWHRQLLAQMQIAVPTVRPAVIRPTTRLALEKYLGFRHIVRNLYTWDFDVKRMTSLVDDLPQVLLDLQTDLEQFRDFLDAAGHADE